MSSSMRDRSVPLRLTQPAASRPARRSAAGTDPPSNTGGPGRCTGAGSIRPAGTE
jgi:hypothetical protein